eukprot:Pgem_evm1s8643
MTTTTYRQYSIVFGNAFEIQNSAFEDNNTNNLNPAPHSVNKITNTIINNNINLDNLNIISASNGSFIKRHDVMYAYNLNNGAFNEYINHGDDNSNSTNILNNTCTLDNVNDTNININNNDKENNNNNNEQTKLSSRLIIASQHTVKRSFSQTFQSVNDKFRKTIT